MAFATVNSGDFASQNQPQFRKKGCFRWAKAMVINMDNQVRELPQTAIMYVAKPRSGYTGDYATVQEAIDALPEGNTTPVIIYLRPGVYREAVRISGDKPFITLIGEGDVKISYDNYAGRKRENGDMTGTFRSATVSVYANHFTAKNITFENFFDGDGGAGGRQALAFYGSGEHLVLENCRFLGKQDTLYTRDGSQYYKDCYIEGDVDFIFGAARTYFENCTIRSLVMERRRSGEAQGYVAAPSTFLAQKYGYVFKDCKLISDCPEGTVYLGRPWHAGSDPFAVGYATYIHCELGAHIHPDGWTDMGGFLGRNGRFAEYDSYGPGAVVNGKRPQLSKEEAEKLTRETVLGW